MKIEWKERKKESTGNRGGRKRGEGCSGEDKKGRQGREISGKKGGGRRRVNEDAVWVEEGIRGRRLVASQPEFTRRPRTLRVRSTD